MGPGLSCDTLEAPAVASVYLIGEKFEFLWGEFVFHPG